MKKLNDFADDYLMTVEEFKTAVEDGLFIDYDGFGYAVINDDVLDNKAIIPSKLYEIPKEATHIVWFNR